MTGLGNMFTEDTSKARVARASLRLVLRALLKRSPAAVLVQNVDDSAVIEGLGLNRDSISPLSGAGVDVDVIRPEPQPCGPRPLRFVGGFVIRGRPPRPATGWEGIRNCGANSARPVANWSSGIFRASVSAATWSRFISACLRKRLEGPLRTAPGAG